MNTLTKPSVVLCHGIWADGSCFRKLIAPLRSEGHQVMAAQYGLDSIAGDVDATIRTFARLDGPILLVGHSYGGTVITHAGLHERVAALVYIAALCPDENETTLEQLNQFPRAAVSRHVEIGDDRLWLKEEGIWAVGGDLPIEEQDLLYATQFAPAADLFSQKLDGAAWKFRPSTYIVTTEDQTIHPSLQRAGAERMGATVVEIKSGHMPMSSHPHDVLDAIRKAAVLVGG
nr:alpha/beta hydrolase [uncultured Roseateles sp.]